MQWKCMLMMQWNMQEGDLEAPNSKETKECTGRYNGIVEWCRGSSRGSRISHWTRLEGKERSTQICITRCTICVQYHHSLLQKQRGWVNGQPKKWMLSSSRPCPRKRKQYTSFTDKDRTKIGIYATEHGTNSGLKKFRSSFPELGESTVHLLKKKYQALMKQQAACGNCYAITSNPSKKCDRPLALVELDADVQKYVWAMRQAGIPVGNSVVIAAAMGIVLAKDCTLLAENGGHIYLTKTWAMSLMIRMGLSERPVWNHHWWWKRSFSNVSPASSASWLMLFLCPINRWGEEQ